MNKRLNVSKSEYSIVVPLNQPKQEDIVIVKWELTGEDKQKVTMTTSKVQLLDLLQTLTVIQHEIDLLHS